MSEKGLCPNCRQRISVWKSIKPVFLHLNCPACQTKLNIEKPILITSIIVFPLAAGLGYPLGKMYGLGQISRGGIFLIFLLTLPAIQVIFSLAVANSELKAVRK